MCPYELERAVARATGESPREIRRRGFQPLWIGPEEVQAVDDDSAGVVDWDASPAERTVLFP